MSATEYSVAKGYATDEELAAVMAVLAARSSSDDKLKAADDRPLAGGWNSYYRTVRPVLTYGRDAWRTYRRF